MHYIVGLARNARLEAQVEYAQLAMKDQYEQSSAKQRWVGEFSYAAQSWSHERRVITRLEWGAQGHNPRFIVTNLHGDASVLYDEVYCQRGEAGRAGHLPPGVAEVTPQPVHYSTLSEIIGSTRVARRAGTQVATSATEPSSSATVAYVSGS